MVTAKPGLIHGRDREWEALDEFVRSPDGSRLALVYGRRRQGKTLLVRSLVEAHRGFYWQATEQSSAQNLAALSVAWQRFAGASTALRFADWREAFDEMLSFTAGTPTPIAIDEVGYLIDGAPQLPSVIQAALDPVLGPARPTRLVLCGSSFGQMRRLTEAQAPLRGRAGAIVVVRPFGYRESAAFWGLRSNPDAAYRLHALVGGTPAYKTLAGATPDLGDIDAWVLRRLIDPRSPLFREGNIVVNEDSSLTDRQLYWSVLAGLLDGNRRRRELAKAMGRPETSLAHPLGVLLEAGWIERVDDPLRDRRTTYRVAEPMVRTWRLLIEPGAHALETASDRQRRRLWSQLEQTVASQIYAPHLERIAGEWLQEHAGADVLSDFVNYVGPSEVRIGADSHQIDLVATSISPRGSRKVIAIGEVKSTDRPVGPVELERLDAIAHVIEPTARRILVARHGFTSPLRRLAAGRRDVTLATLADLYR